MARPTPPRRARVSGNASRQTLVASTAVYRPNRQVKPSTTRNTIAKSWQIEAYRHVNICGEARYAATLFAAIAGRAEIGVSEAQTLRGKAAWVTSGVEVDALAELAPTVRERTKLIRDYMLHRIIAGECYLIARSRVDTDPDPSSREPIWEIVAVTELRRIGSGETERWSVRHENGNFIDLDPYDPVIRMWNPDPNDRMEAWSPFRSLLPTLREIEWLTKHIFAQVKTRLMSAGVWFLPDNLTFAPPPPDAVKDGEETIAQMNEAEQFMLSLSASAMTELEADEPAMPTVVMADAAALESIDQKRLIKFWSEIDDKAMTLRTDNVRRFALGMDLPPEQILGASGLAVSGSGGSAGSVNHWGVWANEEQTISAHVEPALDDFVDILTNAFLRNAVENTTKVIGYDTASLRLRQDRSKEAMEWYDRGVLKADVALRETGFDPTTDMMTPEEHRTWLLNQLVKGSPSPEQMQAAFLLITGQDLPLRALPSPDRDEPKGIAGPNTPPSLEDHPYEGPPRVQHDQTEAPFSALDASCEALVLRALEKAGNRLLNDGKRGKDRDRSTPAHLAHLTASVEQPFEADDFDFSLAPTLLGGLPAAKQERLVRYMGVFCARLHSEGEAYSREALLRLLRSL